MSGIAICGLESELCPMKKRLAESVFHTDLF